MKAISFIFLRLDRAEMWASKAMHEYMLELLEAPDLRAGRPFLVVDECAEWAKKTT